MKLLAAAAFSSALAIGCGSSDTTGPSSSSTTGSTGSCSTSSGMSGSYSLDVDVKFQIVNNAITLFTQNGSTVDVPTSDLIGKTYFWATAPGGEPIGNMPPLEIGAGTIDQKIDFSYHTKPNYKDGPWEMALFISVSGGDPTKGPQATDLAAFSLDKPPPCDPDITGQSVRMDVKDADAKVTLGNTSFIRFTK